MIAPMLYPGDLAILRAAAQGDLLKWRGGWGHRPGDFQHAPSRVTKLVQYGLLDVERSADGVRIFITRRGRKADDEAREAQAARIRARHQSLDDRRAGL